MMGFGPEEAVRVGGAAIERYRGASSGWVREWRLVHSYSPQVERFAERLISLGEGLENAYFSEWVDECGEIQFYVVGNREGTPEELQALYDREHEDERREREELAHLLAKYPDVVGSEP